MILGLAKGLPDISIPISHSKTWGNRNSWKMKLLTQQPQVKPLGYETMLDAGHCGPTSQDAGLETKTSAEICSELSGQSFRDTETHALVVLASHTPPPRAASSCSHPKPGEPSKEGIPELMHQAAITSALKNRGCFFSTVNQCFIFSIGSGTRPAVSSRQPAGAGHFWLVSS